MNWTFQVVRYFTWKLEFVSSILPMIVDIVMKALGAWELIIFRNRFQTRNNESK